MLKDTLFIYKKDECPEFLYHYTSMDALYSMLKNKELWIGNTVSMNDSSEIKEFYNNFKKCLIKELPNKKSSIEKMFKDVNNQIKGKYPFAMSFSPLEDDAAQWERYGDDARGVCIKFKTEELAKQLAVLPFTIDKVNYGVQISDICKGDYDMIYKYFSTNQIFSPLTEKTLKIEDDDFTQEALINLINFAARYKNKGFLSENEYRVFNYSQITSNDDIKKFLYFENEAKQPVYIDYSCSGKLIKKFIIIRLGILNPKTTFNETIDKIIIGPRSQQSRTLLQEYVQYLGYSTFAKHISDSECTLR